MDQQEARNILREYADVFAKDNLDLGQTSVVKYKTILREEAKPGLYEEMWITSPGNDWCSGYLTIK